jgi:RNA polymerase sigma factor (sigma-70 family)
MQYTYTSVTGVIEAEISDHWHNILVAMDREEFNSDRRQSRHCSISLNDCVFEGEWFEDKYDAIAEIETLIDMELILASLTELQRICFVETRLHGKTQREVAAELGKSSSTIQVAVDRALAILKNILR